MPSPFSAAHGTSLVPRGAMRSNLERPQLLLNQSRRSLWMQILKVYLSVRLTLNSWVALLTHIQIKFVCLALRGILEKGLSFYITVVFLFIFGGRKRGEGWRIGQSLSNDQIHLRLWPVINTNDPGIENCSFHGSFFLCIIQLVRIRYACPLVVVAGGEAVSLKGGFAFWYPDRWRTGIGSATSNNHLTCIIPTSRPRPDLQIPPLVEPGCGDRMITYYTWRTPENRHNENFWWAWETS